MRSSSYTEMKDAVKDGVKDNQVKEMISKEFQIQENLDMTFWMHS